MAPSCAVRAPASSANLGAGFDTLGLAVSLYADVGVGEPPPRAHIAEGGHPAAIAFLRSGGDGPIWVRTNIPMGRGLGFSGSVRVAGALVAHVQRDGEAALSSAAVRDEVLELTSSLEGHADNVGASLFGGLIVAAGGRATSVPLGFDPAFIAWIPPVTTSTEHSRGTLPQLVPLADAAFNIGRAALFVAACVTGDSTLLRDATEDRLHQQHRLGDVPDGRAAIQQALDAGAWAAWLSGSGPTIGILCDASEAASIAAALPASGGAKVLTIDHEGPVLVDASADDGPSSK